MSTGTCEVALLHACGVAVLHALFSCEIMTVGHCVHAVVDIQLRQGSIMNTVDHVNLFFVHFVDDYIVNCQAAMQRTSRNS